MSAVLAPPSSKSVPRLPPAIPTVPVWRFTVEDYHHLIDLAVLTEDDPVELLEGYLVPKMPRKPRHDNAIDRLVARLRRLLPETWRVRCQMALTLSTSEPEPDVVLALGDEEAFEKRHPEASDVGMVVEVSDSTLEDDRTLKGRIYARSRIPVYWIVNLLDRQLEVYTSPTTDAAGQPAYGPPAVYRPGDQVPVVLFGQEVGKLAVGELLPG